MIEQGGALARDFPSKIGHKPRIEPLFGIIPVHILFDAVIITVVVLIFMWLVRGSKCSTPSSLEILKRRYAAGEIDRETFLSIKKDMEE